MELYPLKFETIYKDKIWGGNRIQTILGKDFSPLPNCGESWELSGVDGDESIVSNGFLAENTISELIEIYMGDLVGESVYEQFGLEFPLLIKFLDSNDWLSVQVHPNDELAEKRHNCLGKNEMWYVIHAEENAQLITGLNKKLDKDSYLNHFNAGKLNDILQYETAKTGDVFNMPTGRIHAMGPGLCIAEIQQTSDITYRISDWDRVDAEGNSRELHTELAIDAIDFKALGSAKIEYSDNLNDSITLVKNKYFKTNLLHFDAPILKDYTLLDSFVIYICTEGEAIIDTGSSKETIKKGETVLIPAIISTVNIFPISEFKILEVYIDSEVKISKNVKILN